jgi:hypothetical protein
VVHPDRDAVAAKRAWPAAVEPVNLGAVLRPTENRATEHPVHGFMDRDARPVGGEAQVEDGRVGRPGLRALWSNAKQRLFIDARHGGNGDVGYDPNRKRGVFGKLWREVPRRTALKWHLVQVAEFGSGRVAVVHDRLAIGSDRGLEHGRARVRDLPELARGDVPGVRFLIPLVVGDDDATVRALSSPRGRPDEARPKPIAPVHLASFVPAAKRGARVPEILERRPR